VTDARIDKLRKRLGYVAEKTKSAKGKGRLSFWGDEAANYRLLRDESGRGRLALGAAHAHAVAGLAACDDGDLELADTLAWSAMEAYVRGLEQQVQWVRPEDRETLAKPAKRRGRPHGSRTGAKKDDPSGEN